MRILSKRVTWGGLSMSLALVAAGCASPHNAATFHHNQSADKVTAIKLDTELLIKQSLGSYCQAGEYWGTRLRNQNGAMYGEKQTDQAFSDFLWSGKAKNEEIEMTSAVGYFYFGVSQELKDKFNSCFTTSYKRMDADKVLGWHVAKAAHDIGSAVGEDFARWPLKFFDTNIPRSKDYNGRFKTFADEMNQHALLQLEHFNELLTVGSPADRQAFKVGFVCHYRKTMTSALEYLDGQGVKRMPVNELEKLEKGVTCDTPHMQSLKLIYNQLDAVNNDVLSLIYANHPLFAKDTDELGFRVFTGEELYLRFYRRALHEAGLDLGKKLYHNLTSRDAGIEYIRNLSLAVDRTGDIQDFFAPGFLEGFATDGSIYLSDMLCAVDKTACPVIPVARKVASVASTQKVVAQEVPVIKNAVPAVEHDVAPSSTGMISKTGEGPCYVHVGSFTQQENTLRTTDELHKMNVMNVLEREVALSENRTAVQVRVGPYSSRETAQADRTKISHGFSWPIGHVACVSAKVE